MTEADAERKMQFLFALRSRGVRDTRVLEAMEKIDRDGELEVRFRLSHLGITTADRVTLAIDARAGGKPGVHICCHGHDIAHVIVSVAAHQIDPPWGA